jgi:5-methyltetrahydrofolate--homocysteine methyltransferase
VEVCTKLKSPTLRDAFVRDLKSSQQALRESFERGKTTAKFLTLKESRALRFQPESGFKDIKNPPFFGIKVLDSISLREVSEYIDWSPFFWSWELKGKYPAIFEHPRHGEQAKKLFEDAQDLLRTIIENDHFKLRAVYGYFKANSMNGEDIELESPDGKKERFHFLRQQKEKIGEQTYYALPDFIAPRDSGKSDVLGAFCVTAGGSVEDFASRFEKEHDDYSSSLIKALGDRFAEATAEWLHAKARKEMGVVENLTCQDLIEEKYQGIRPALGYPACPDHSEKTTLFELLQAQENVGVSLTSSFAMLPASSVSGLLFFHPEARYFNVGPINDEQLRAYAERKGVSETLARNILAANHGT